jgi:uncharacterized membrane protein YheB (UPF0754 family)
MTLSALAPYLLPPLLGAFIGYVTNHIAIRMLFRPLRPWRLFGLRVPLTPGVIPGKRHELAERIGAMVGSHLLTADDVGRALEKEAFRRELHAAVAERLGAFLDRELGPAATLLPEALRPRLRELAEQLRWRLLRALFAYLESAAFEERFRELLRRHSDEWLGRDLASLLTPERSERLRRHLDERLGAVLQSEALAQEVAAFVDARLERWLASDRPLRELLPPDLFELLLAGLERELPQLLEKLAELLRRPEVRTRLAQKAQEGIAATLDSLDGLSGVLAAFINLDKIYARLPELLDRAGDELARWLREEQTRAQVAHLLRERLEALLERSPAEALRRLPYEEVAGLRRFVREQAVALLRSRRTAEALLGLAERGLERLQDRSFASLLAGLFPEGGVERGREWLAQRLLAALRAPQARQALERLLAERSEEWLFHRPLGRLSERLPADLHAELEEALCRQIGELLKREVPALVETLNVRQIVAEKVDSLDILQVEGLLLGIMQEQFRYINLFGALLGGLIGLVNLLALRLG